VPTQRVTITIDSHLLEQARQLGDLSAVVSVAAALYMRDVMSVELYERVLAEARPLLYELDDEFGPVPDDVMEQARHDWRVATDAIERAHRDASRAASADPG
jgi:hypothetical protein